MGIYILIYNPQSIFRVYGGQDRVVVKTVRSRFYQFNYLSIITIEIRRYSLQIIKLTTLLLILISVTLSQVTIIETLDDFGDKSGLYSIQMKSSDSAGIMIINPFLETVEFKPSKFKTERDIPSTAVKVKVGKSKTIANITATQESGTVLISSEAGYRYFKEVLDEQDFFRVVLRNKYDKIFKLRFDCELFREAYTTRLEEEKI